MKKITAVTLAAIMILALASLAGCGATTTAGVYARAIENKLSVDAYEANMTVTMDMTVAGESIATAMDYVIKVDDIKTDSPKGYAEIKMDLLGRSMDVISYAEGDYIYVDYMGEGMKLLRDSELAADYDMLGAVGTYDIDVPAELLEATELTKDSDGNYVLEFTFDGEEHAEVLSTLANNVLSGIDASFSDYDVAIGDVKYALVINKSDYTIKTMMLEMTMSLAVEEMNVEVGVVAECEYVAFGDAVVITPPEGYQNYEELIA